MPNWCYNNVQILAEPYEIQRIKNSLDNCKGKNFFDIFVPNAEQAGQGDGEKWYQYNIDTYGCKWNCDTYQYDVDGEGTTISISFDSPWSPPIALYEIIYHELNYNVLAYYDECGMAFCGRYEDGDDYYYDYSGMSAEEIEDMIPDDINEFFELSERQRQYEEENENED